MNDPSDVLRGLIAAEAPVVDPPTGARERGWDRLTAALTSGATPRPDVLAPPRAWWPWILLGLVLLLTALAAAWFASTRAVDEPALIHATPDRFDDPPILSRRVLPADLPPSAPAPGPPAPPGPTPRPMKKSDVPVPAGADDSFAAELRLIAAAQAALRDGDEPRALRTLKAHARDYPAGHFAHDREALRAVALCTGGRAAEGSRLADAFLAAHADSIHADRVRDACRR